MNSSHHFCYPEKWYLKFITMSCFSWVSQICLPFLLSGMLAINTSTPQDSPPVAFPPFNIDLKQNGTRQLDTGCIFDLKSSTRRFFESRTNTTMGAQKPVDGPKASKTKKKSGRSTDNAFQSVASYKGTVLNLNHRRYIDAFKDLHPAKASTPMLVTESVMLTLFKELHLLKAWSRMLVTESGMLMLFKDLHRAKALLPMLVTAAGILTFFKDLHPAKALSPMLVSESGMSMLSRETH